MMTIIAVMAQMLRRCRSRILRQLGALCCLWLMLLSAGCAASSTTRIEEEVVTNPKPMYRYTKLLIQNLELKRELYSDASDADMSERGQRYERLPEELSGHIERFVTSQKTFKKISRNEKPDAATLVLTGKFIRLGRFKISIVVNLRDGGTGQDVASFRQTLWDVMDTTDSFSDLGRETADFLYRIQYK